MDLAIKTIRISSKDTSISLSSEAFRRILKLPIINMWLDLSNTNSFLESQACGLKTLQEFASLVSEVPSDLSSLDITLFRETLESFVWCVRV